MPPFLAGHRGLSRRRRTRRSHHVRRGLHLAPALHLSPMLRSAPASIPRPLCAIPPPPLQLYEAADDSPFLTTGYRSVLLYAFGCFISRAQRGSPATLKAICFAY